MPGDTLYLSKSFYDTLKTFLENSAPLLSKKSNDLKFLNLPIEFWAIFFIPIISFSLGLAVAEFRGKYKQLIKSNEKYFFNWIELISEKIKSQSIAVSELAKNVLNFNIKTSFKSFNLHIDKLKNLTPIDIHRIFVINKKGSSKDNLWLYYKTVNSLDFFERKSNELVSMINQLNSDLNKTRLESTTLYHEFNILRIKLLTEKGLDLTGDDFLFGLYSIHEDFKKHEENETNLREHYLDKINALCNKYLNINKNDQRITEVIRIINKLLSCSESNRKIRKEYSGFFVERHKQLEESFLNLSIDCKKLEELKFKNVFFIQ